MFLLYFSFQCIILLALCGIAAANVLPLGIPAAVHAPVISTGASTQTRSQDGLGNYAFAYKESHGTGGTSRSESGNAHGQVVGSYSLGVVDGRQRTVNYVADALGFRAAITSNEPGVAPKPAAATSIATPGLAVAAAPVLAAPAIAAPIHAPLAAPLAAPYLAAPVVAKTYAGKWSSYLHQPF